MKREPSTTSFAGGEHTANRSVGPIFIKVFPDSLRFRDQNEAIEETVRIIGKIGQIAEIKTESKTNEPALKSICSVCGWIHDSGFNWIIAGGREINLGNRILAGIVAVIHKAHENNLQALDTKSDVVVKACNGYKNPCKAFDSLRQRGAYKILFYTRRRGLISLAGFQEALGNKRE